MFGEQPTWPKSTMFYYVDCEQIHGKGWHAHGCSGAYMLTVVSFRFASFL